jgi:hypothetical protein
MCNEYRFFLIEIKLNNVCLQQIFGGVVGSDLCAQENKYKIKVNSKEIHKLLFTIPILYLCF